MNLNNAFQAGGAAVIALMLIAVPSQAAIVTGTLFIDGSNNVVITAPGGVGHIHFLANSPAGDNFQVNAPSTGTFQPLGTPTTTFGKITSDLDQGAQTAG